MNRGHTIRAVCMLSAVLILAGCLSNSTGTAAPTRSEPQALPTGTPVPTPTPQHAQSPLPAPRSEQSISPLPSPAMPDGKATTAADPASQDTVAHMRADLAARLEISQDEIVHVGSHLLLWQAARMQCPPPVEVPSEDYIMIVDQDGARYELPRAEARPGKTPASLYVFSANDQIYRYYVVAGNTLFCPDQH